jgi:hypothetical protein
MAKLWIWDKLLTLMRLGEAEVESAGERSEGAGEGCTGTAAGAGVGCCDCGRKRGLVGVGAACWGTDVLVCCCGRWPGVELEGGAPESGITTSAEGARG